MPSMIYESKSLCDVLVLIVLCKKTPVGHFEYAEMSIQQDCNLFFETTFHARIPNYSLLLACEKIDYTTPNARG